MMKDFTHVRIKFAGNSGDRDFKKLKVYLNLFYIPPYSFSSALIIVKLTCLGVNDLHGLLT